MGGGLGTGLEGIGDIHEEVEAGAGLYGIDGRDCWGHIGGVRVEEVGTAYCRGHYSRTWEGAFHQALPVAGRSFAVIAALIRCNHYDEWYENFI